MPEDEYTDRIARALNELAKGMKSAGFYPPGHPSLIQAIDKTIAQFEEIPLPEEGLEIEVTKNALLYRDSPLPSWQRAIADLNRELYMRRASKVIFLPGLKHGEMVTFLRVLNRDIQQIQDEGGIEQVLLKERMSRIWVNRVDYQGLTEMLKRDEEMKSTPGADALRSDALSLLLEEVNPEDLTFEDLLGLIQKETDPGAYRDLIMTLSRALAKESPDLRLGNTVRALTIFIGHIERPPLLSQEIAQLARLGIKEMASDEIIHHYVQLLRDKSGKNRKHVETVLTAFEDRAIKPLLKTIAEEEDLLVRKSIVEIIVRIGRPAVPIIIENLNDTRWFVVRNLVTILGSLGFPDLAPDVAAILSHPDLRVKKEAIKALSKLPHPSAVTALGELCFFPEETIALTATAALSSKKEEEAVLTLYRRVVQKRFFYPNYRLAHEGIDALRMIGTDDAVTALTEILRTKAVWETPKFKAMKTHALRSLSKMRGDQPMEALRKSLHAPEKYLRLEAERLLSKS